MIYPPPDTSHHPVVLCSICPLILRRERQQLRLLLDYAHPLRSFDMMTWQILWQKLRHLLRLFTSWKWLPWFTLVVELPQQLHLLTSALHQLLTQGLLLHSYLGVHSE